MWKPVQFHGKHKTPLQCSILWQFIIHPWSGKPCFTVRTFIKLHIIIIIYNVRTLNWTSLSYWWGKRRLFVFICFYTETWLCNGCPAPQIGPGHGAVQQSENWRHLFLHQCRLADWCDGDPVTVLRPGIIHHKLLYSLQSSWSVCTFLQALMPGTPELSNHILRVEQTFLSMWTLYFILTVCVTPGHPKQILCANILGSKQYWCFVTTSKNLQVLYEHKPTQTWGVSCIKYFKLKHQLYLLSKMHLRRFYWCSTGDEARLLTWST